tara:strand:+ start:3534 stop:4094 length:561 start_codon:yes stop_codon:yes gene_type:complete
MRTFIAKSLTNVFRWTADTFFASRYGHRAVVLETVAGVPPMVAGMMMHLKSLRKMDDRGPYIAKMLAEAENERMHLMFFMEITKPTWFERWLVVGAQFVFWHFYLLLYIASPKTAHRMVAYFEKEAVNSYTEYLRMVKEGEVDNVDCPKIAIQYYDLPEDAKLADLIIKVREDEKKHSKLNLLISL